MRGRRFATPAPLDPVQAAYVKTVDAVARALSDAAGYPNWNAVELGVQQSLIAEAILLMDAFGRAEIVAAHRSVIGMIFEMARHKTGERDAAAGQDILSEPIVLRGDFRRGNDARSLPSDRLPDD